MGRVFDDVPLDRCGLRNRAGRERADRAEEYPVVFAKHAAQSLAMANFARLARIVVLSSRSRNAYAGSEAGARVHIRESDDREVRGYIMCSSFFISTGKRSTEMSTTGAPVLFCHQCCVPLSSDATSPVLCTIGTAQLLAYSMISPETM